MSFELGVDIIPNEREKLRWLVNVCGQDSQMIKELENRILNARSGKKFKITPPKREGGYYTFNLPEDKEGRRRKIQKHTRSEVLQEIYLFYYGEEYTEKEKITFDSMWCEYLDYLQKFVGTESRKGLSSNTIYKYNTEYHRCFDDTEIQKMDLRKITTAMLNDALLEIVQSKNLTRKAFNTLLSSIRAMFKRAKNLTYIKENPCSDLEIAPLRAMCRESSIHEDEERILNDIEIHKLLRVLKEAEMKEPDQTLNYAIELALYTGLRVGELAALKYSDVRGNMLFIERSEHEQRIRGGKYHYWIGETKTRMHRAVPLSDEAQVVIENVRSVSASRDDDYIFRDLNTGERKTAKSIGSATARRGEAAGLQKVSIHRIRRTFESKLAAGGIPANVLADWIGHSVEVSKSNYQYNQWTEEQQIDALRQAIRRVV